MTAKMLKTEYMTNPVGIDVRAPELTWLCEGGERQTAYEIRAFQDGAQIWDSGRVESSDMRVPFDGALHSRDRIRWQVRLWDENGKPGEWSGEAFFEMGLLEKSDFKAQWIDPEIERDPEEHKPASYLKKSFTVEGKARQARLYVTCHGLYEVWLNGTRVGNFVLAPGSSSYSERLFVQTYDVGSLLREGENEILVILGDGWYRSCSGVDGERNLFGEDVALWLQLEAGGKPVCVSDGSWEATQRGPIRMDDMQQGEVVDARLEELTGFHSVNVRDYGTVNLCASNCVPVTEHERFPGKLITTPNGESVLDFGQNLAGYIEFTLTAHEGDVLMLLCGETLDENGNFTQENFQDRPRHQEGGIRQQVIYTCKEGVNRYKTKFSVWGFRYAKVETEIDLSSAVFTAIAVYSDMERTGFFTCGNEEVNKLVENTLWSMKSNFCDVPTDCPTRERAAWTGDMGVFIDTGLYLMDCATVVRKWLGECRVCQYPDGRVENIAPRNKRPSFTTGLLAGSVGWGDASIIVPWAMYRRYGDRRMLAENYKMMRRWYGYLESRADKTETAVSVDMDALPEQYRAMLKNMPPEALAELLKKFSGAGSGGDNPYAAYTIEKGTDYGEWCEPDTDSVALMKTVQSGIATAYYAHSGRLLAEISAVLGEDENAEKYAKTGEGSKNAYRFFAAPDGAIRSDRQAEYVRAIDFDLLSEDEKHRAAADLNDLVIKCGYHLNTGFLSTPALLPVLTEYGYTDTAYRLLLQDTCPGWLYEVRRGATTVWEEWDGINEKGEVKASLNHYSKGAVCGWLFSGVCGIRVKNGRINIAPNPSALLGYAEARYMSPLGEIVSGWKYGENGEITYTFRIPSNASADITLPDGRRFTLGPGEHRM